MPKRKSRGQETGAGLRVHSASQDLRGGQGMLWTVTTVIALAILVTFFAISSRDDDSAQNQAAPASTTTGSGPSPAPAR